MRKASLLSLIAVALLAGGRNAFVSSASADQTAVVSPTVEEVAAQYLTYRKMTPLEVVVPAFAVKCVPTTKERQERARERYGPHVYSSIYVYMNDEAARVFESDEVGNKTYPVGAVIVKQKLIFGGTGQEPRQAAFGVGGMVKRSAGFDSGGGDWEYFYFEFPEKIEAGRLENCAQCHQRASARDFVFGTWID